MVFFSFMRYEGFFSYFLFLRGRAAFQRACRRSHDPAERGVAGLGEAIGLRGIHRRK